MGWVVDGVFLKNLKPFFVINVKYQRAISLSEGNACLQQIISYYEYKKQR